jgi:hypothetical protein
MKKAKSSAFSPKKVLCKYSASRLQVRGNLKLGKIQEQHRESKSNDPTAGHD